MWSSQLFSNIHCLVFFIDIHIINHVMTQWVLYKISISEQLWFLPGVQSVQVPTTHSCTSHTDPNPLFTTPLRPAENIRTALIFFFCLYPIAGNEKKKQNNNDFKSTVLARSSYYVQRLAAVVRTSPFSPNRSQCGLSEASSGAVSGILHTLIVKTAVTVVTGAAQWGHIGRDKQIVTRLEGRLKRFAQVSVEAQSVSSRVHVAKFQYEAFTGSQLSWAASGRPSELWWNWLHISTRKTTQGHEGENRK